MLQNRTESYISHVALAAAVMTFLIAPAALAGAPSTLSLANGITAAVYDAAYLSERLTTLDGAPAIRLDDGRYLPVTIDINDPSIHNKGDGSFHPFPVEMVEDALAAINLPGMRVDVRIYVLPYPRRNLLVSSTSGNEIFLSPHVLDIEAAVGAYIIAHEVGHAFHNRFMPEGSTRWSEYRRVRGIEDASRFHDAASHAYRPREIFAEDFRVLFGGSLAAYDGRVENVELASPATVDGLESFYTRVAGMEVVRASRIVATGYPNPFNPETEIRVAVPDVFRDSDARVSVAVYSVTGALVRELYTGRATGDFVVRWDGRDRRGEPVASSTYYARVVVGDERETLKLTLLK